MATLSAAGSSRLVTLTGSGYAGTEAVVIVAFTGTGPVRRFNEMRRVPVVAGDISADVSVPFAGSVTVRAIDPAVGTQLAITGTATVT